MLKFSGGWNPSDCGKELQPTDLSRHDETVFTPTHASEANPLYWLQSRLFQPASDPASD
jgi:hypothetical protein